ncbi:MAG: energy transducer TonB [Acidobacteria bacterium]|nr:energy transducer TonB [Acidobacteriota bacterium]
MRIRSEELIQRFTLWKIVNLNLIFIVLPLFSKLGGDVKAPVVLDQPLPFYTDAARKVRIEGTVLLQLVVRKDGKPDRFKVLKSLGYGLDESAIFTVRDKWRFKPGTYKGEPADVQIMVETSFKLY